jgi:hypothetical protein
MYQQVKFRYMPMVLLVLAIMLFQGCSAPPRDYLNAGIQLYDKKQ